MAIKLSKFAGLVAVSIICSARQVNGFMGYVIIHVFCCCSCFGVLQPTRIYLSHVVC